MTLHLISLSVFVVVLVQGMWLMLQQETPDDFVLATGEMHSVKEFVQVRCATFKHLLFTRCHAERIMSVVLQPCARTARHSEQRLIPGHVYTQHAHGAHSCVYLNMRLYVTDLSTVVLLFIAVSAGCLPVRGH